MEHAIRAQIHARIGENPVFAERLSVQLARIIAELQQCVIDAAEACQRLFELRDTIQSEADIAADASGRPAEPYLCEESAPGRGGLLLD